MLAACLALTFCSASHAGVVDQELASQLSAVAPEQMVAVIISLKTRADTNAIKDKQKAQRRKKIVQAMRDHAKQQHPALLAFLKAHGATAIKPLWIVNSIAAKVPASLIPKLAKRRGVARVSSDATLGAPVFAPASLAVPEWNLMAIHAPELWGLGHTGAGVVVATMDTGVDVLHPDLAASYRGGGNSWFDPHGQYASPADVAGAVSGHGTQTMGLIVAGDGGGTSIGSAPGAQWIAAKIFDNQGDAQVSDFHLSFQWLLDPDNDPQTDDAPDIVNGSFQTAQAGICDTRFQADIQFLKMAGIAVVFAAGNSGPGASSSSSPANNPGSFAAGSVDNTLTVAGSSARGPAPAGCGVGLFPHLVAPGESVLTTDLSLGGTASYATVSGTSFAAPHVAGSMALLLDAFPNLEVSALESALLDTATDLGEPGPDNVYGYGLLNVQAAYNLLAGSGQNPIGVGDSYQLDEDTTLTVPTPGVLSNDSDPQNDTITALLEADASHGTLALNADGSFSYTPAANYNGLDSFSYRATDGAQQSGVVTVVITVNPLNDAPVAADDGAYTVISGQLLTVPAVSGVLVNDVDTEHDPLTAVLAESPTAGLLVLNADGSFSFDAQGVAPGAYSFKYFADDGIELNNQSNSATVNINVLPIPVNTAPTANGDSFLFRPKLPRSVNLAGALGLGVLMNDGDAQNDELSARYVANSLSGGGSLQLNADGSFSYSRAKSGSARFRYRADDGNLLSQPDSGTTVYLRSDAAPKTGGDNCRYDIGDNLATYPERCEVLATRVVKMKLLLNDSDPNAVSHVPSDGVGSSVAAATTVITSAGTGVRVLANPQCGQAALGDAAGSRGTVDNNCDGTVTVTVANGNSCKSIGYRYKVSDDLGAQSSARAVTLSVRQ